MSRSQLTISIVIPCYNAEQFVREAIDSALNQTHRPVDVIVVDDGSADNSAAIAESYGPLVQVIRQHNQGPSVARNVGTAASRGDYLLYLDADDLLAPDSLKVLADAVANRSNCVALMSCATFEDDPRRPISVNSKSYDALLPHIIRANLRNPICWLTPRYLFDRVNGFSQEIRVFEDWDFWAQIALVGAEIECVPYVGGFYRKHSASVMRTVSRRKRAIGHVQVTARLATGILRDEKLLDQWGGEMFWSAWTALHRARHAGVPWHELKGLSEAIRALASRGPLSLRKSRYAQSIRVLGVRCSEALRSLIAQPASKTDESSVAAVT